MSGKRTTPSRRSIDEARQLAHSNIKLAWLVAHRLAGETYTAEELVGYAYEGLLRAAETYDEQRGTQFSTHAVPRIHGSVLDGMRREKPWSARVEKDRRAVLQAMKALNVEYPTSEVAEVCEIPYNKCIWLYEIGSVLMDHCTMAECVAQ